MHDLGSSPGGLVAMNKILPLVFDTNGLFTTCPMCKITADGCHQEILTLQSSTSKRRLKNPVQDHGYQPNRGFLGDLDKHENTQDIHAVER